ncbi:plantaricin C family lantibiotic [Dorea longicatena]|uniref:plantaricin C family lantibiotic n=1 Tax=Dorea longicatena TaxID=88431 RepID=UPI000413F24E|nr:plantaricin C family lantibiotic [Dorea longicatena]
MKKNLRSNVLKEEVAGNVMTELNEAELGEISGAGSEARGSNGGFCTLTVECNQLFTIVCCK